MSKPGPYAAASAAACAAGVGVSLLFGGPAVYGAVAASLGAVVAFAALWAGIDHGTNGVLAGFTAGFFARGIAVALGLIASGARNEKAIAYVVAFFCLYAATQAIEILFVRSGATT